MTDRELPDPAHTARDGAGSDDPFGAATDRPSAARVYDVLLGGSANFEVDREMAGRMLAAEPQADRFARANRSFLRRAVQGLLDEGVDQFVDLGSGLPTVGNVHEIVHAANPDGRVVYVDVDPVAVGYSRYLLAGVDEAAVVQADVRDVDAVLDAAETRRLIDFSRPVGVLAVAVLHFVDDDPAGILDRFRMATVPGSYLVLSHLTTPAQMTRETVGVVQRYRESTRSPLTFRSRDQVVDLFAGWELLPPGVVPVDQWSPEPGDLEESADLGPVPIWAGVGLRGSV
ncbi:SAM-dependent methyltransferase [Polymorphospora sp. NPDC050346]|uniref:SAM-dependent methyltransferase n=1 Tax=Polymorphospora sp. NPDC050346 TaxID=3155780 RepID=UPI0033D07347